MELLERYLAVEPVERLPSDDGVGALIAEGKRLGGAVQHTHRRQFTRENVAHA